MTLPTTAKYAGLLRLVRLVLAAGSGWLRSKAGVSLGDGGSPERLLAVRRHGDFMEWVPLALILLAILELNGVPRLAIHVLGGTLLVAGVAQLLRLDVNDQGGVAQEAGPTALVVLVAAA
jgi:uncharacterized membrane protein YecN with MAPEG domain